MKTKTNRTGLSEKRTHMARSHGSMRMEREKPKSEDQDIGKSGNNDSPSRLRESLLVLEPRIMFDGAALVTGAEVSTDADQQIDATDAAQTDHESTQASEAESQSVQDVVATYSNPAERQELVFIDTSVGDYQTLIEGIDTNAEIILLDSTKDGIEQIAEVLEGRSDIDAIHIVSHGNEGELQLGTPA